MTGAQLSEVLDRLGWQPRDLRRRLGIARRQTIRRWLNDQVPIPEAVAAWLRQCLVDAGTPPPTDWRN